MAIRTINDLNKKVAEYIANRVADGYVYEGEVHEIHTSNNHIGAVYLVNKLDKDIIWNERV